MRCQVLSAGFGGQGILFLGDLLCRAALKEGKSVTYLPTYGVAMRGGTANCVVTISDQEIGSPILDEPEAAIVLNEPSLEKFQPIVQPGGLIVANSSIIAKDAYNRGGDIHMVWVPATETAREVAGTERATNMVALGAFLGARPLVSLSTVEALLREFIPAHRKDMIGKNLDAIRAGIEKATA